jgi:hypothetical protein
MDFPPYWHKARRHEKDHGVAVQPLVESGATLAGRATDARLYHAEISGEAALPQVRGVQMALRKIDLEPAVPAVENRAFMTRAVTYVARQGVRQFLDIGAGLPAWGNVHDVAARFRSDVAVAYVDNDPEVVGSWWELSPDRRRIGAVEADLRRPESILGHPEVLGLIDLSRPVCLLLGAVVHAVADQDEPHRIVRTLVEAVPPGSFLVLSQVTGDGHSPQTVAEVCRLLQDAGISETMRPMEEITNFFHGVELLEPGVVATPCWRPARPLTQNPTGWYVGGVGRKP